MLLFFLLYRYVRGLENHLDENDVKEGFEKFGEIVSVNCTMNPELHINRY